MEKHALQLASTASMIDQFIMPNIDMLLSLGYAVDVVANFSSPGTITIERAEEVRKRLISQGVHVYDVPIPRKLSLKSIMAAYKLVKEIISKENYSLIHCHSPIGGAICRMAAKKRRKKGTRVIYTAHGFHFYTGAPLMNWLLYFPVEKYCSRYTDVLITINQEDYSRAQKRLKSKKVVYLPGTGVNIQKFQNSCVDYIEKRRELGVPDTSLLLLSVGELNKNKNHSVIIEALAKLKNPNIHYCIAGIGEFEETLRDLCKKLHIDEQVHLLGYRTDIPELDRCADVFLLPSIREGLNVSVVEAMASGLPIICSINRGNKDFISEGVIGCRWNDSNDFAKAIEELSVDERKRMSMGKSNRIFSEKFAIEKVGLRMQEIYSTVY